VPRTYLIFGDIDGKLDVLNVECTKCAHKGRYHVRKLIEKYGRMGQLDEMEGAAQRRLSVRLPRRSRAWSDNAPALSSDNTQERGFYRLVCIEAKASAFIAE
jgi:hypothetical protein